MKYKLFLNYGEFDAEEMRGISNSTFMTFEYRRKKELLERVHASVGMV
jgi:hypothetical protein